MVEPAKRSRSVKKRKVRTPGGHTTTHYKAKKHGKAVCGRCHKAVAAVQTGPASEVRASTRSQRTPDRPWAGTLCASCTDELVRYKTRFENGGVESGYTRDLTLEKYLPRGWFAGLAGSR